jgi:hypothetical protein
LLTCLTQSFNVVTSIEMYVMLPFLLVCQKLFRKEN